MDKRRIPRLSLDLLRGFRAAARHLSFTRAAQEQCVTQSAISHEVKALEEQLGQPLFHRVNRSLQLTQAGVELHRTAEEALALLDATTARLACRREIVGLTTTTALASTWLVPRLPQFVEAHPEIDLRIAASNDMLDLQREQLDLAVRFVLPQGDVPQGELLVGYETFPVCSPAIIRDQRRPLRAPADLVHHVLLDFEAVLYSQPWYDWTRWFEALKLSPVTPAARHCFSQYDQVIQMAMAGSGIAIGKRPHLMRHLQQGLLMAPFGDEWVADFGGFYIVVAPGATARSAVASIAVWLKEEVRRDAERRPAQLAGSD